MLLDLVQALCETLSPQFARQGLDLRPPLASVAFSGRNRDRAINFFVFGSSDAHPVLFVKTSYGGESGALDREYDALSQVGRLTEVGSTPFPVGLTSWRGRRVLVQIAVPGTPLTTLLRGKWRTRRSRVRAHLVEVTAWLKHLQHQAALDEGLVPANELLTRCAERLRAEGLLTPRRLRHLDHLGVLADQLASTPLPFTCAHGDLWPGNILLSGDGVAVVDWQHFSARERPYADLWFFLLTYTQALPLRGWSWLSTEEAFRRCFLTPSWYSSLVWSLAGRHLSSFGWPEAGVKLLLFLFLVEQADEERPVSEPVGPRGLNWWRLVLRATDE